MSIKKAIVPKARVPMSRSNYIKRIAALEEALSLSMVSIAWFNDILKWTLDRCENTPLALLSLIREGAHKRFSDAIIRRGEQEETIEK